VLGIGHHTNMGHCGKMLDNNMIDIIDILNCSPTNVFESDGLCNGMGARLERTFSGSIESKTDGSFDNNENK
jgi:hypothetical protein